MKGAKHSTDKGGAAVAHDRAAIGSKTALQRKEQMRSIEPAAAETALTIALLDTARFSHFHQRNRLMLTLATQELVNGVWTLTPAEPATLELAVVGFAMLATYAVVAGWRPARNTVAAKAQSSFEGQQPVLAELVKLFALRRPANGVMRSLKFASDPRQLPEP